MRSVWNTKYGTRRVRHDPPTLAEAIIAAQGLSDNPHHQAEIAAELMGLTAADVLGEVLKARTPAKTVNTVAFVNRAGVQRAAIVERKTVRRPATTTRRFGY
jgi:hypothetical protein